MPKLPVIKPKEAIRVVKKIGFILDHVSGSHYVYYNPAKTRRVTIPFHNRPLKRQTLKSIIKDSGLSVEDFKKLL